MALNRYFKNENKVKHFTLLVTDYNNAVEFYTNVLNFKIQVDEYINESSRWITVHRPDQGNIEITFVMAKSEDQLNRVGTQGARHSFMVLCSENWEAEINRLKALGLEMELDLKDNFLNSEAVFKDLYGNKISLIPRAESLEAALLQ